MYRWSASRAAPHASSTCLLCSAALCLLSWSQPYASEQVNTSEHAGPRRPVVIPGDAAWIEGTSCFDAPCPSECFFLPPRQTTEGDKGLTLRQALCTANASLKAMDVMPGWGNSMALRVIRQLPKKPKRRSFFKIFIYLFLRKKSLCRKLT